MSLDAIIIDPATQKPIEVMDTAWGKMPLFTGVRRSYGHFKSVTHTTNETKTLTTPIGNGSLRLSDLIISGEKITGGIITVRFYDGTNAVNIVAADCNDAPCNMAISFNGRWQGWKAAYIQTITSVNNQDANISLGYMLVPEEWSLDYDAWDAERR